MPLFDDMLEDHSIDGSSYGYSATRVEDAVEAATEYTIVGITCDCSGSVWSFRDGIEACVKEIVKSCRHSPRSDNLMLRLTTFDSRLSEFHGFKPLGQCNVDDYNDAIKGGGATALFDAAHNMIESVTRYGKSLYDSDCDVNAIVFVITDGDDNVSTMTANSVNQAISRSLQSESLESILPILVGVNITDPSISRYLKDFQQTAGFAKYIELDNASETTLAKLADFISKSISMQSQSLGTGGPSAVLDF